MDRQRLVDMEDRLRPVRTAALAIVGVALLLSIPWVGWWTLAPLVVAAAAFELANRMVADSTRPEYVAFIAWAGAELTIAAAVALADDTVRAATFCWIAIPVVTLSARFSIRGVCLGVAFALALLAAVGFGTEAGMIARNPPVLIAPAALVVSIAILSTALMRSDLDHRAEALIDPLTGMLNRNALTARARELAQQSAVTGEPIGLIEGDIDHFKSVNDSHGHAVGDTVLQEIAEAIRKRLRAFDLAYRIGGEEFLILVPGATLEETAAMAEVVRAAIEADSFDHDARLTMSFGVSATLPGQSFDYDRLFGAADSALFEAKRLGRNRVCTSRRAEVLWEAERIIDDAAAPDAA